MLAPDTDSHSTEPADLLTIAEVAAITRAPISTVRYWRHMGTGPQSFRLGRRVVFRRADLDRWMAERENPAAAGEA
jgi:excisionase family DNA binding protein